ncbi:MAG: hypothetical protein AAF739_16220 [Pseudomonadota bacterium]
MDVKQDEELFVELGKELATRFIEAMARILHESQLVDFDLDAISQRQKDLLQDLSFFGIIEFEARDGLFVGPRRFDPQPAFKSRLANGAETLCIGNAQIHAFEDDQLWAAIERARRSTRASEPSN